MTHKETGLFKEYFWKSTPISTRLSSKHPLALSFQDQEIHEVLPFQKKAPPELPFIKGWVKANRL